MHNQEWYSKNGKRTDIAGHIEDHQRALEAKLRAEEPDVSEEDTTPDNEPKGDKSWRGWFSRKIDNGPKR